MNMLGKAEEKVLWKVNYSLYMYMYIYIHNYSIVCTCNLTNIFIVVPRFDKEEKKL